MNIDKNQVEEVLSELLFNTQNIFENLHKASVISDNFINKEIDKYRRIVETKSNEMQKDKSPLYYNFLNKTNLLTEYNGSKRLLKVLVGDVDKTKLKLSIDNNMLLLESLEDFSFISKNTYQLRRMEDSEVVSSSYFENGVLYVELKEVDNKKVINIL